MSSADHLRIVHGGPSAEEVAALTAVLAATCRRPREAPPRAMAGGWHDPAAALRTDWPAQRPGAWRASAR